MRYHVSGWSHFFMAVSCCVGLLIAALPDLYPKMDTSNWFVFGPAGLAWFLVSAHTLKKNLKSYIEIGDDAVTIGGHKATRVIPFGELDRVGAHNGFVFLVTKTQAVVRLPLLYEKQTELFEHLRAKVQQG